MNTNSHLPTMERYRQMEAFYEAWGVCNRALIERAHHLHTPPSLLKALRETLVWVGSRYTHTENFHNMIHMLEVVTYHLELGVATGSLTDIPSLIRHTLAAAYHDIGNGPEPGPPGVDRIAAIAILCDDWITEGLHPLESHLTVDDLGSIAATILASVFRDRFASVDELERQPYLFQATTLLQDKVGLTLDTRELAAMMRQIEATTLMHADLCGSLTTQSALKYTLANRWEDRHKPGISHLIEPSEYPSGFIRFLCGEMHFFIHHDRDSQSLSVTTNSPLMQAIQCWIVLFGDLPSCSIEALPSEIARGTERYCAAVNHRCRSLGAPPINTSLMVNAVEEFSAIHGWHPSVFGGLGSVVSHFGFMKLQRYEREVRRLVLRYHDPLKTFHILVTQEVPVTKLPIEELRARLANGAIDHIDGAERIPSPKDSRTLMEILPRALEHALLSPNAESRGDTSRPISGTSEIESDKEWLKQRISSGYSVGDRGTFLVA